MVESRWRIGARGPPWYKCKVVCVMCDSNILSDTNKRLPVYLVKNNWRIPTNASCSDMGDSGPPGVDAEPDSRKSCLHHSGAYTWKKERKNGRDPSLLEQLAPVSPL